MQKPGEHRVLARVEKLLRLASPTSGTSEHERASAALEAVKLIEDHDLVVTHKPEPAKEERRAKRSRRDVVARNQPSVGKALRIPLGGWARSIAARDSVCADPECHGPIFRGELVWMRIRGFSVEYLHEDWPCAEEFVE